LTSLKLKYCYSLESVDAIRGLKALSSLDLSNCAKLQTPISSGA